MIQPFFPHKASPNAKTLKPCYHWWPWPGVSVSICSLHGLVLELAGGQTLFPFNWFLLSIHQLRWLARFWLNGILNCKDNFEGFQKWRRWSYIVLMYRCALAPPLYKRSLDLTAADKSVLLKVPLMTCKFLILAILSKVRHTSPSASRKTTPMYVSIWFGIRADFS